LGDNRQSLKQESCFANISSCCAQPPYYLGISCLVPTLCASLVPCPAGWKKCRTPFRQFSPLRWLILAGYSCCWSWRYLQPRQNLGSVQRSSVGAGATTVLLNIARRHRIIGQYDRKSSLSRILDLFRRPTPVANWSPRRQRTGWSRELVRGRPNPSRANINLISFSSGVGWSGHVVSGGRSVQTAG